VSPGSATRYVTDPNTCCVEGIRFAKNHGRSISLFAPTIHPSPNLALSTPLPLSPALTAEANDNTAPGLCVMAKPSQGNSSISSSSAPGGGGPRHALPLISPVVSMPSSQSMLSPTARARRAPSPSRTPAMHMTWSSSNYKLNVQLPTAIQREMITVSAKKGDRIAIVADAWHMEEDCE
jgi:hypothetical protein